MDFQAATDGDMVRVRAGEVQAIYASGTRAWPGVTLSVEAFARRFSMHATPALFDAHHAEDLVLAYACAEGDEAAMRLLQQRFGAEVRRVVTRIGCPRDLVPDVEQAVWTRLFVGPGGNRPKIAEYGGRGSLRGWLRTVTSRVAIDELQLASRQGGELELAEVLLPATVAPETAHLHGVYRQALEGALSAAIATLAPRARTILRLYYLDGLSIDRLGALYGIHRATAARQVHAACDELSTQVRRQLADALGVGAANVDSILRLLGSQLERLEIASAL